MFHEREIISKEDIGSTIDVEVIQELRNKETLANTGTQSVMKHLLCLLAIHNLFIDPIELVCHPSVMDFI